MILNTQNASRPIPFNAYETHILYAEYHQMQKVQTEPNAEIHIFRVPNECVQCSMPSLNHQTYRIEFIVGFSVDDFTVLFQPNKICIEQWVSSFVYYYFSFLFFLFSLLFSSVLAPSQFLSFEWIMYYSCCLLPANCCHFILFGWTFSFWFLVRARFSSSFEFRCKLARIFTFHVSLFHGISYTWLYSVCVWVCVCTETAEPNE